jgi:hypothetical protein
MSFLRRRENHLMEMPNYVRKIATIQVQSSKVHGSGLVSDED